MACTHNDARTLCSRLCILSYTALQLLSRRPPPQHTTTSTGSSDNHVVGSAI